jgi:hypothetical protein
MADAKKRYLVPSEADYKVGGYQGNKIPLMVIIMWLMFIVLAVTYTIVDVIPDLSDWFKGWPVDKAQWYHFYKYYGCFPPSRYSTITSLLHHHYYHHLIITTIIPYPLLSSLTRAPEPAVKSIPRATAAPTPPPRAAAGKAARPSLWARLRKLFAPKAKETSPVPTRRPHAPVHRGSHAAQGEPRASGRRPEAASPRGRGGRGTENPRGETPRGETPRGAGGRERRPEGRRDGGPQETRRSEAPVVGASPAGVGTSGAESREAGREGGGRSRRGRRGGRGRGGRGASSRPMSPLNGENMPLPGLNSSSPPPAPPAASPPKSETASAPSSAERSPAPRPSSQDEPLVQVETQTPARSPRDNGARATTPDLPPALRELYESGRGESSVPPPSES